MYAKNRGNIITWVLVIVLIAIVAVGAYVWLNRETTDETIDNTVDETQTTVTETTGDLDDDILSRIVNDPTSYYGQQVTVEGEIQDVYERRILSISDQTVGDELLVLLPRDLTEQELAEAEEFFEDNADASVTGEVMQFSVADVEANYTLDILDERETEFEGRPVIVAQSFSFSDGTVLFDFDQGIAEDE